MNLPTKITFSRIIAIVILMITLFVFALIPNFVSPTLGNTGINVVFLVVFVFFLLACYTDHLDGHLARKNNQVTTLGKFLDPVADKMLVNSMAIFLVAPSVFAPYIENVNEVVSFNVWCAIILVVRDIIIDALRQIAAQKNIVLAANIFGKIKTVLEMVAISLVLLNDFPFSYIDGALPQGLKVSDMFVYLCTIASIVSGVIYLWQNRKVFIEEK